MTNLRWIAALTAAGAVAGLAACAGTSRLPTGRHLKCLVEGKLCVGMKASEVIDVAPVWLGHVDSVYCRLDAAPSDAQPLSKLLSGGCGQETYLALFQDRRCLSGVTVKDGVVVDLSRDCRDLIDFG